MVDQLIIFSYLLGILILGLWSGRGVTSLETFSVAGRSYSYLVVFATLSASFIGGGFSIGNAEKVFLWGIANIVALWGFSLKEILVASFIAPRMHRFSDVISPGDIMMRAYGLPGKLITGFFSVLLCAGILGAQVGGIGYIFNVFLGIPQIWGILIGCGIIIAYSTVGGMRAVVFTDIVQFLILSVAIPLTLVFALQQVGGISGLREALPAAHFQVPGSHFTPVAFISLFLTFVLGETLVPPYLQRLYIGKNSRNTAAGTLLSGLFSIPFFAVTGAIGLVAFALKPDLDANLALPFVINEVLPMGLKGLVVAGIISIVMSSADSFLNSAAVAFTNDLVNPLRRRPLTERQGLVLAKVVNLLVGILAVVFAVRSKSVLDILIYAYNFWSPIILVPLVAALMGFRATMGSFLGGAGAGIAAVVVWNGVLGAPGGMDGLIVGVACNLAVFSLITACSRPKSLPVHAAGE
jgi:SSS family solute:Na+ symporter